MTACLPARWLPAAALLLTAFAIPVPGARADAPPLIPHQVAFVITPDNGAMFGSLLWDDGQLVYRRELTCDQWVITAWLTYTWKTTGADDWSWSGRTSYTFAIHSKMIEARDGHRLESRMVTVTDGIVGTLYGQAVRQPDGRPAAHFQNPGPVRFPNSMTVTLPPGTLFPEALIRAVIDAAAGGARQHEALLFDGSAPGATQITSVISDPRDNRPFPLDGSGEVAATPSWQLRVALNKHHPLSSVGISKLLTVSMVLYANGVLDDILLDSGGITARGRLVSYERLPDPDC